jgi:hypothetical protein
MFQIDPWEKAAECAQEIHATIDPHQRSVFINLQLLWIALGNERSFSRRDQDPANETDMSLAAMRRFSSSDTFT